jgi:hypothetical protein
VRASDYSIIADIIRSMPKAFGLRNKVSLHFAEKLQSLHQRFNKDMFLQACGYTPEDAE